MSEIFLAVQYNDRLEARELGCKWNPNEKLWYIPSSITEEDKKTILERFDKASKLVMFLNVSYSKKDDAKAHGARFNFQRKQWYAPRSCNQKNYKYLMYNYT